MPGPKPPFKPNNQQKRRPSPKPGKGRKPTQFAKPRGEGFAMRPSGLEETGQESLYFKKLVDSESKVVVVLKSGEQIRGVVRYYDRDMVSVGPDNGGPNLFVRKDSMRYLYEA